MAQAPRGLTEVEHLRSEVAELRSRVAALEDSNGRVIVLRSVDRDQAKREILELFRSGETLYYSDISERLRIDLVLVVEICQELGEEGEIDFDANAV